VIGWLKGVVRVRETGRVVLDVSGVGYLVLCPMSTFLALPAEGGTVELHVSTQVREESITLHGFLESAEREIFERLLTVSGVGPRTAMAALSALGPDELARCIAEGDSRKLSTVPGIGRKTAERIVIDLQDRMAKEQGARAAAAKAGGGGEAADVVSALVNLGYNDRQAARAVQDAKADGAKGFEALLRAALARLGKG
jgi:Holliday junction DNA helicase RuvA